MRKLHAFLIAAAFVAIGAGTAGAVQYPPGPGAGGCDTLSLINIQNPTALCHPASGDTVYGIRGIVIGFDAIPTAFGFWIELPGAPQWGGVEVFTGATNYATRLSMGDLVSVSGRAFEFTGNLTEVTDFDNIQSTNDIIVNKLSSGNAQPPYAVGTPHDYNWIPGISAATAEPYEGMLVKIRGPLVVGRNSGNPALGSRSFLVCVPGGADSALIDGFNLTNVPALAVGTVVDSVQGILHQSTVLTINAYRIQLRGPEDLFAKVPPNLTDAFPVEDNILRLTFDRDITQASAENTANYSLGSFGTVNSATLVGTRTVILTISNGLVDGDNESVTASGIVAVNGLLVMTSPQSRNFVNGVLTLATIQAPDPTLLGTLGAAAPAAGPCYDRSRFTGTNGVSGARLSYRGVATGVFGAVTYLSDPLSPTDSGERAGMPTFGSPITMVQGHQYLFAGQVQEFDGISTAIPDGLTEGVGTVFAQDEGTAPVPEPRVQTIHVLADSACDRTQTRLSAEDFESVLIQVRYARITEERAAGASFLIAGPNGNPVDTILVSNSDNAYTFDPDSAHLVTVTGVLTFRNGNLPWRILPRSNADIQDYGALAVPPPGGPQSLSFSVRPNPARVATFSFTLPEAADVDLGVYDVSGRKLAQVLSGSFPAGSFTRAWNGRGTDGSRIQPGMYFYRLKTGGKVLVDRGVMLR